MFKNYTLVLLIAIPLLLNSIYFIHANAAVLYGDLNSDGLINSSDYALMKRSLLRITTISNTSSADLNGDGLVNSTDYTLLRRFLLNIISEFPVQNSTATPTIAPTPIVTATPAVTKKWVGTWGTAPQLTEQANLPPSPGLSNNTLRQVVRVSIAGNQVRLNFSNQYGNSQVTMNSVHLAVSAGGSSIKPETDKTLTFNGKESVTIAAGKTVTSDILDYDLPKLTEMTITIYFGSTSSNVTGHPGSRTTSYIQSGNAVKNSSMPSAATTEHWYIITGIDVFTEDSYNAVVTLGDSITDGRGSTTNKNNRWPDVLASRLQGNNNTSKVAVINQGIGGNTVLSGGLGPTAIARFDRDVIEQSGVRWLIIFEGVNDIGSSYNTSVATNIINTFRQFISKAHEKNILVYGATILPFGGSQYSSAVHEEARQMVNNWIRTSGEFDAVIDLDKALRNPNNTSSLLNTYDSGDHLHPSVEGHKKIADTIELELFTR